MSADSVITEVIVRTAGRRPRPPGGLAAAGAALPGCWPAAENEPLRCEGKPTVQPGQRPLKRHDSHMAQHMVERAAELARDSHARTRHAVVLVKDDSLLAWGTNGVPFPGEDHCYCKFGESGNHDQCRTHAEQRAITLARAGDGWRMLPGSKLIYVRLEADDSVRLEMPHFCARCSRLALSLGVAEWIFALSDGLVGYSSADYDQIAQLRW
jgi:deoxycytidylate deaminase